MMIGDWFALANLVRDLSKESTPGSGNVPSANKEIVGVLSRIYFSPEGVLEILECLVEGREIDEEKARRTLLDFNDYEGHLDRDLEQLSLEATRNNAALSIREKRLLKLVGWQKISARRDVQRLLNFSLTHEKKISRRNAEGLLARLKLLNNAIEDAEERLRS